MNPAILGALIGAIPGTLAAGLTTWVSIQSNLFNLKQAQLTFSEEHERWLREKRADVYVEILQFTRDAEVRRYRVIGTPDRVNKQLTKDEIEHEVENGLDIYWRPDTQQLIARVYAYASDSVGKAFEKAWNRDLELWSAAKDSIEDGNQIVGDRLRKKSENAAEANGELAKLIVRDLQGRDLPGHIGST